MDLAQTRRPMKTMKKTNQLQITLDGLSSILDVYPDSDLSAELNRIRELSERTHVISHHHAVTDNLTVVTVKIAHEHLRDVLGAREDMRSLSGDWQRVGGDFLNAYQKARKSDKKAIRKDDADCWSY